MSWITSTSAPASVCDGSYSTVARWAAKLTLARCTPSTRFRLFSIRAAQAAQDIPVIGRSTRSLPLGVARVCALGPGGGGCEPS